MKSISLLATSLLMIVASYAQKQSTEIFTSSSHAIRGYDPVSYFKEGKPVEGNDKFSYNWKNAVWLFSSKNNLDSFTSNPGKFAPQYGGWCAYGCSDGQGHLSPTDPRAWTIVDGKLYLNYNIGVRELWRKEQNQRIEAADKNWPVLMNK